MKISIFLVVIFILLFSQLTNAQPDLGILWQKEIPGMDVKYARFSADGQYLYLAVGESIRKMSVKTGEIISIFGFKMDRTPMDMNISKNGKYLIATTAYTVSTPMGFAMYEPGTAYIYDLSNEQMIQPIFQVYCSDISPDGKLLYIGFLDNESHGLLVYNLNEKKEVTRYNMQAWEELRKIKVSNNGKYLTTGIYQDEVFYDKLVLWKTDTLKIVADLGAFSYSGSDLFPDFKFSPNDEYFVNTRNTLKNVNIYDLKTNKFLIGSDNKRDCHQLEFLPDNQHYLISYSKDGSNYSLELHDMNSKIKDYPVPATIIESYDSNGVWKIYCCKPPYHTMLTNQPTSVNEANPDDNVSMSIENGKVVLGVNEVKPASMNIAVYDLLGNTIYYEAIAELSAGNRYPLNVTLPSGIYVSKVITGGKEYSFKLNVAR